MGLAAAAVLPGFIGPAGRLFAAPAPGFMTLEDYYDHFGVDAGTIRAVIAEALSRGGDYCDVYFEHTMANAIVLEDKAVNRAYGDVDFGVGIRVLKGDQTGYSFTEEITPQAMKLAASTAANIASSGQSVAPVELVLHRTPDYYPIARSWEEVSVDEKIPYVLDLSDRVAALDPRIVKTMIALADSTSYILLATSEGRVVRDWRPHGTISAFCVAEDGGRREQGSYDLSGHCGLEFFTAERLDYLARKTVRSTVSLFDAVAPEAGEMEVVLAAGSSGILLHEAIGHGMEADFNRKKSSIFSDKMGKPVARDFVSIVDDGTLPGVRGSLNIDDEGNDTQRTYLVTDGVLTSYLHDRISTRHYKVAPTGNGRRESFRYPPMPRMRNTFMLAGSSTPEEVIASVKHGLYAEQFTNGEVQIGPGDFSFYVKSGNMIEGGRLGRPVKDINIIGNGPEVLGNVVMVANDLKMADGEWNCGKNGQSVPASQGLPTVKVSKITVGGVNS